MNQGSGGHASTPDAAVGAAHASSDAGPRAHDAGANPMDATSARDAASDSAQRWLVPDPSWTCGMPGGIPPAQAGDPVFEAKLSIAEIHDLGETQYGRREQIDVSDGSVTGPKIDAQVLTGALDYQLTLQGGSLEIEEIAMLQANDGALMYLRMCGVGASGDDVRIVPDFEAPTGSAFAWLNDAKLAGTRVLDRGAKQITLRVYDMASAPAAQDVVQLADPAGVANQSWQCATPSGSAGAVVYMETVGIGASLAVGDSKRGTRNVIPITGGTTSGRVAGSILAGGADFQLIGSSFELDARYTLKTGDGELIIVRNCGPLGALVPVFETRKDGAYAWLNQGPWLSSDPSVGPGVVNLTMYETN